MTARGVRLNNPGNIRITRQLWQGEAPTQIDPAFITFTGPQWGLRAIAKIMLTYQAHGLDTVRKIVSRWAPSGDHNDTLAYIKGVARDIGVNEDEVIDLHNPGLMAAMLRAIVHHENGEQPYSEAVIEQALKLAGVA